MTKKYDLSSKSDMRRFSRDLEKSVKTVAKESITSNGIEYACPHCGKEIQVTSGKNICQYCKNEVAVTFDFSKF